ncbi:MAG TPA: primosomal protein N' [Pyrinomonadaceae bacterium]|nr:primosomal protein N' [Pyrinomonadaceae bacterium]
MTYTEYVEVAVPYHVSQTFIYRLPTSLRETAHVGARIIVPLGRRLTTGYIVNLLTTLPLQTDLVESEIKDAKHILDSEPLITPEVLQITRWVSDYYAAPWGEVIKAALPLGSAKAKQERVVRLLKPVSALISDDSLAKITEPQSRVLKALEHSDPMTLRGLLKTASVSISTIKTLEKRGIVEISLRDLRRDPLASISLPQVETHHLTAAQVSVLKDIEEPIKQGVYATFLLHGVTGSGKTEVYIRAMRICLELGRSAMMLVPEIVLTPIFSQRLRAHFGDQVSIFHSALSKGERFDEWMRVRNGSARIVIGTRSAVFAPLAKLGLVIVDEEHESTYRQQDSPRYNGRDTAIVRAQKESAVVILGSATPSLESFHNAQTGKYRYLKLPDRIANRSMAASRIIDMRKEFDRYKRPRIFSDALLEAIQETHERHEQSMMLLNRRGYSTFVLCRSCGETIECPNCDVTLTYHRAEQVLLCHYCNHRQAAPNLCPTCKGKYIYYVGHGTEQIEQLLAKLFPTIRMARIDRDTAARRGHFERVLMDFSAGRIDMLVGTQMLAKGHDFPNVTLVGVVSVDAGLALPDFRAAERTFQLITQVAGRAGRGDRAGQVMIQTYHPNHYALRHSNAQDYMGFYNDEIRHRRNHSYPPFVALASLLVHGPDLSRVRSEALELRREMDVANKERIVRVLGPAPAPLSKLKGEHRIQLLVKSANRRELRRVIDTALVAVTKHGVNLRSINVEIDPVSIM